MSGIYWAGWAMTAVIICGLVRRADPVTLATAAFLALVWPWLAGVVALWFAVRVAMRRRFRTVNVRATP